MKFKDYADINVSVKHNVLLVKCQIDFFYTIHLIVNLSVWVILQIAKIPNDLSVNMPGSLFRTFPAFQQLPESVVIHPAGSSRPGTVLF